MTATERRHASYRAAVNAAIAAAPPIGPTERERLARVWRASGSALVFETPATSGRVSNREAPRRHDG